MGNNKFKFSDMIPNAWFYKLKDMSKSKKRNGSHVMKSKVTSPTTSQMSHSRYLNYFPNEPKNACKLFNTPIHKKELDFPFNDSPRRSSKRKDRRKTIYKPSPLVVYNDLSSIECSSESSDFNQYVSSESDCDGFSVNPDFVNGVASNCSCRVSSSTNDIIIDMMNNNESFHGNCEKIDDFDAFSTIGLAPILTKQVKFDDKIKWAAPESRNSTDSDEPEMDHSLSMKVNKEGSNHRSQRRKKKSQIVRKSSPNSPGIRLRVNSPKIGNRKIQACARKSVSSSSKGSKDSRNDARFLDGFAVVKSSIDPQSDFKESMVEMIVENNIRESKDLEDLLACYLSLNSSEYHDLIVKAFEQIWYDMAQLRM